MADNPSVISLADYYDLGAKFNPQSTAKNEENDFDVVLSGAGDYACSSEYNTLHQYPASYKYCDGGAVDIDTDLAMLAAFGDCVTGSDNVVRIATSLSVTFEAGKAATVDIEGHQHAANAHAAGTLTSFDCTGIIPAASGVGVPTLITVAGTASPVSATLTFTYQHNDTIGANGDHWGASNVTCKCELSVQYEGTVTGATAGDWLNIKISNARTNTEAPTSTLTAEQYIAGTAPVTTTGA